MSILSYVFEKLTGRPYRTTVSATAEYGPTPGAEIFDAFGVLPDYVLFHNDPELLAAARRVLADRTARTGDELIREVLKIRAGR